MGNGKNDDAVYSHCDDSIIEDTDEVLFDNAVFHKCEQVFEVCTRTTIESVKKLD